MTRKFLILLFALSPALSGAGEGDHTPSFLNYLKQAENGIQAGFRNGLWFPHASVEGGSDTIAYGHKILPGEDFSAGITEEEATALLIADLHIAEARAKRLLKNRFDQDWEDLNREQREIFLDFQFNGVLSSFPKFTKAVLALDMEGMRREHRRYCQGEELRDRNRRFAQRYLTPETPG